MNNKKLLIDYIPLNITSEQINESIKNGKDLFVYGVLQRADTENQNGRIYPKKILQREAKKFKDVYIKEKRAMGELDHPDSSVVSLKNVSHSIEDLWWENNDLLGKIKVLTTPSGNILKELIKCSISLGISSRGLGTVKQIKESDAVEVQEDFELLTFDMVSSPSTQGAFMNLNEGIDKSQQLKYIKINNLIRDILREE